MYYLVRRTFGIHRFQYIGFDYFLTESWWTELTHRLLFHLGWGGMLLLLLVLALWLALLFTRMGQGVKFKLLCIFGAAASIFFLFNADIGGKTFTGYFRFLMPVYLLLVSPLLLTSSIIGQGKLGGWKRLQTKILMVSGLICALHAPTLLGYLSLTTLSDSARNFTEHYDAPIYLPIRSLITKAERAGALELAKPAFLHINHVIGWNQPKEAYGDLDQKYNLRISDKIACACSDKNSAILAPFVHYAGLTSRIMDPAFNGIPQLHPNYIKSWEKVLSIRSQCLASLKATCTFYEEEAVGGQVVGAIGVLY